MQDSQYILDPLSEDVVGPSLKPGNAVHKLLAYIASGEFAKLVPGICAPTMLTSRADLVMSRIASCALATLMYPSAGNKEAAA